MRGGNTRRLVRATLWAAALTLSVTVGARAQVAADPARLQQPANAGINVGTRGLSPLPPAPEATLRAFQAVCGWVQGWKVQPAEGLPATTGAYVTLRLDGQIIGRGMELAAAPSGDSACISLATTQALEEARRRVPIERDALFDDNLRALAPRLAVTLELAGTLIPFAPKEYADAAAEVPPGVEGVAVRAGERTAAMFPEQMLVNATDPGAALSALASKLADDPAAGLKKPAELAAERGFVFYRFKTSTIGQPKAGAGGVFLQRGGGLVPQSAITEPELRQWAIQMAGALIARFDAAESRNEYAGTLDPCRGDQATGVTEEELIVLIALQYARHLDRAELPSIQRVQAAGMKLLLVGSKPRFWEVPVPAGLFWTYLGPDSIDQVPEDIPNRAADTLLASFREGEGFAPSVPTSGRALVANGLVMAELQVPGADATKPGLARPILQQIYAEGGPGMLASHMPWLGHAELLESLREGLGKPRYDRKTYPIKGEVALREMRSLLWQHQLKPEDLPPDQQDLAGGIVFTASKKGQPAALPTWQAARPLAFIATMLGDERLTDEKEVPAELSRLLASLRFLRQLTAEEAEGHMYANPALATGGVRASPFDQRMPPEATAFTLMTVCETLQSLEKIRKRQQEQGKAAPPPKTGEVR